MGGQASGGDDQERQAGAGHVDSPDVDIANSPGHGNENPRAGTGISTSKGVNFMLSANPLLVAAAILFLISLLCVFRPPLYLLWKVSVPARELGHALVVPCLLLAWLAWLAWAAHRLDPGPDPAGRLASLGFLAAAAAFGLTVARAYPAASVLARAFRASFGEVAPGPSGFRRTRPLSFRDLFLGIPLPRIEPEVHAYARGGDGDLRLDFYRAQGDAGPAPCVVLIHGGGWDSGSRSDFGELNRFLAAAGYAVASLDYRLAPRHIYPAPVEDVREALAWLKARAGPLGLDAERFVLMGRSAGGQIALQAAYLDRDPAIRGVVAFYAPADMVLGYRFPCSPLILDSPRLMEAYLGAGGEKGLAAAASASPLECLSAGAPPTLLLHGRSDVLTTWLHSEHMRIKLGRLGVRHFAVDLPWAPHGYDWSFRGPGSQISLYFLERFLAEVVYGNRPGSARAGGIDGTDGVRPAAAA
jgi:acetyl esterase/lipase